MVAGARDRTELLAVEHQLTVRQHLALLASPVAGTRDEAGPGSQKACSEQVANRYRCGVGFGSDPCGTDAVALRHRPGRDERINEDGRALVDKIFAPAASSKISYLSIQEKHVMLVKLGVLALGSCPRPVGNAGVERGR